MIVTGRWLTQVLRTDEVTHMVRDQDCAATGPLGSPAPAQGKE